MDTEVTVGDATPRYRWALYTGANGPALVSKIPGAVLVPDLGETLMFTMPNGDQIDAVAGQVVMWRQKGNSASGAITYDQAAFEDLFNVVGG